MKYALLPKEDWNLIADAIGDSPLPHPSIATASVSWEGNKLTGALFLQPAMHVEPLWIHPDFRGKVNPVELHKAVISALAKGVPYYAFAPSREVDWIIGSCGMKLKPWKIWEGIT